MPSLDIRESGLKYFCDSHHSYQSSLPMQFSTTGIRNTHKHAHFNHKERYISMCSTLINDIIIFGVPT